MSLLNKQQVIIIEGPDGCGKTEIGKALSKEFVIPYFKMTTEHENWKKGRFKDALQFDQPYISEFLSQTKHSCVIDRAYPSEYAYSKVFNRETCTDTLEDVDCHFSSNVNPTILLCLRRHYFNAPEDELVENEKLELLHNAYLKFAEWTTCNVVLIYVDEWDNDLEQQLKALKPVLAFTKNFSAKVRVEI